MISKHEFFVIAQPATLTVKRLEISNVKLYVIPLKYNVFRLGVTDADMGVSVSDEEGHGSVTKRVNVCFTKLHESGSSEG